MQQNPRNNAPRWRLWISRIVIILIIAAGGFWYWINIPPKVEIPTLQMPHPNGYDFFLRASEVFVKDDEGVDRITDSHVTSSKKKHYPIAAKEAWLKKNAKALRLLRTGLKYPAFLSVGQDEAIFPHYHQFADMALALRVESHVKAAHHDWLGASNSILDVFEFGNNLPHGGSLYSNARQVGLAMQVSGLQEMLRLLPYIDGSSSRKTALRMEQIYAGRFLFSQAMQEEKWRVQRSLLKEMNMPFWRWRYFSTDTSDDANAEEEPDLSSELFVKKQEIVDECSKLMDQYIANAHQPYSKMGPIPNSSSNLANYIIHYFYSEYPNGKDLYWTQARVETFSTLVMTMLALRAFRMEHGYYPAHLQDLVPKYLTKVPVDPFDGIATLRYQINRQRYQLWSIGPDGVDNQAKPVISEFNQFNCFSEYQVCDSCSKGDVVAGVNVP